MQVKAVEQRRAEAEAEEDNRVGLVIREVGRMLL